MEIPDPPSDTPGASKKVFLTPHDIPRIYKFNLLDLPGIGARIPFSEPRCFLQLFVIIDLFAQITSDFWAFFCCTILGDWSENVSQTSVVLGEETGFWRILMGKFNNKLTSKFNSIGYNQKNIYLYTVPLLLTYRSWCFGCRISII